MVADIILEKKGYGFFQAFAVYHFLYNSYVVRRVHFTDVWVLTISCGPDFPIPDSH